jgi:hypothetical protein
MHGVSDAEKEDPLARALRNQSLWLVLTYVGLLLLIARAYR